MKQKVLQHPSISHLHIYFSPSFQLHFSSIQVPNLNARGSLRFFNHLLTNLHIIFLICAFLVGLLGSAAPSHAEALVLI